MSPLRVALGAVVVVVMGCAILGIGMGSAPAERERAPSAAAVAAARERIEAGGATVRRGRELFTDEGCDRCHSIAAISADGELGPRLDALDEDLDDNIDSIADPRDDIADGYPEKLMPDFGDILDDPAIRALAAFVTAASGGDDEGEQKGGGSGDDSSGRGRGRGRSGRSGED